MQNQHAYDQCVCIVHSNQCRLIIFYDVRENLTFFGRKIFVIFIKSYFELKNFH